MNPSPDPPEGFAPHFRRSAVTDPWEPIYSQTTPEGVVRIGLSLRECHCNSRGLVHGAVIAALADNAMGLSYVATSRNRAREAGAGESAEASLGAVTVSLSVDFVATARLGQWLQVEPRVIRAGRTMGFTDALVTADGEAIARASATFRML